MVAIPAGLLAVAWTTSNVSAFCLDRTEVTVAAYSACGACSAPNNSPSTCNFGNAGRQNHPVNCLDWNQAVAYCASVGKRLPTEAEWEWAARGGADANKYPWGPTDPAAADAPAKLCWSETGQTTTCPVGAYSPAGDTAFGARDMGGNVWEMVDGTFMGKKSYRGGAWSDSASFQQEHQTSWRDGSAITNRGDNIGFRCAKDP